MKIKRCISMFLFVLLCVGLMPTKAFAAGTISVTQSFKNADSKKMVLTVNGETRSPFKVEPGEKVRAEITVKPKDGMDLAYVIVGNSYSPTQGSANDLSTVAGLTQISCDVSAEGEYNLVYEFTIPEATMLCIRVVCDVPPEPEPEPVIEISTKSPASVEYDSGAVEFLGVVTNKTTGDEITEGEVQYYLNGEKIFTAVKYDSARIEEGFYRSISTDEVFDETALQMGENSIYAIYSDGEGHTATSNTVKITVVKKNICKEQSPISTTHSIGVVYDGTPGYGRAQFSMMSNDDYWQKRNVSIENLSFTAEKDGVEYELTSSDYQYKGNNLIIFAAPYPGTYTFTAHVNHEYYTGEKSVTVTVGKRDIVICPADVFTNRNKAPVFMAEIDGMGLVGDDKLKNVQYKIEDGADLGVPGTYSVEIVSYEIDHGEYYNVTLKKGTLTVLEDANYLAVYKAIEKVNALNKDEYKDFSAVEAAINAVVWDKNITEQDEVDDMAKAIEDAISALEYKDADYTSVNEAIEKTNSLDKTLYKDFSGVEEALASVVEDLDITHQKEVDAMAQAILDAISGLEVKPADTQTPSTSDHSSIILWIMVMIGAAMSLISFVAYDYKKKYNH